MRILSTKNTDGARSDTLIKIFIVSKTSWCCILLLPLHKDYMSTLSVSIIIWKTLFDNHIQCQHLHKQQKMSMFLMSISVLDMTLTVVYFCQTTLLTFRTTSLTLSCTRYQLVQVSKFHVSIMQWISRKLELTKAALGNHHPWLMKG